MKKIFIIVLLIFISNTISLGQNNIHDKLFPVYNYSASCLYYLNIKGEKKYKDIFLSDTPNLSIESIIDANSNLQSLYRAGINTYIDKNGKEIIKGSNKEQWIQPLFNETFLVAEMSDDGFNPEQCWIIDNKSKVITSKYQIIVDGRLNNEYLYIVQLKDKFGLLGIDGKIKYPIILDDIRGLQGSGKNNGFIGRKNDNWYYIKKDYESILPDYSVILDFYCISNMMLVGIENRDGDILYGFIDMDTGKEIISCKYKYLGQFSEGLAMASINGKDFFYIDKNEKIVFHVNVSDYVRNLETTERQGIYLHSFEFINGATAFYEKGRYGLVDKKGRVIIQAQYDNLEVWGYHFLAELNDRKGVIDKNGNIIIPLYYDRINCLDYDYYVFSGDKKGLYKSDGSIVIPCEYKEFYHVYDNIYCMVSTGDDYGYYDSEKQMEIVECKYSSDVAALKLIEYLRDQRKVDVDSDIPQISKAKDNTFAFIIANEDYPQKNVPFALNDGRIFKGYCIKALGIKEKRVNIYENATGNNIIACVEKIKQIAEACDGDANIIFYYAGHAFPDEERSTGYLLPVDGDSKIASTGYSLEKLYKELSTVKTKSVICFIDACFSGATREDEMLLAGRGVAIKVKEEVPTGNIVVFSSATGAETAHQYEEKEHGMFTYFLLKKLQETKGDVTLGELSEYIIKNVKLTSVIENDKPQTPTVIPSQALQDKWQKIKL
ncbi:MAG: WG repeat-containing protein [Bacteroidales bacterium]|nr:WG repeat-containing protein [Bacteroidales bacterium]